MATPPTRVLYATPAVGYGSSASPKTTPTFDVVSGDLLTVIGSGEDSPATLNTPTATGGSITWTLRQSIVVSQYCTMYAWTGAVGATATGITVSVTGVASRTWSFGVTVWRNHGGVGVTNKANVSGAAPSLTLTGCSANSAIVTGSDDWNAADGTTRTWRTVNGSAMSESLYFRNSLTYTVYSGYAPDSGAAGNITVGLSAPGSQKYSIVGIEVLAASGGSSTYSVSGTADAVSGASGAVAAILLAAGTAAGISGATGDVTRIPRTLSVSGTAAAVSGASGDVTRPAVTQPVTGTAAAISAAQGAVASILQATGTATATSTATGDVTRLPRTLAVTGTADAVSGASGSVSVLGGPQTYPVTGTAAASSGASGSVSARLGVTGTAAGVSSASGNVTVLSGPVVWQVTGTAAATSGGNGVVTLIAQAAGTAQAVSSSSGNVTNTATPLRDLDLTAQLTGDRYHAATTADRYHGTTSPDRYEGAVT